MLGENSEKSPIEFFPAVIEGEEKRNVFVTVYVGSEKESKEKTFECGPRQFFPLKFKDK